MKQDERINFPEDKFQNGIVDSMRYYLAATICAQNRSRAQFISNVKFGDPVWDLMLSLYTAEYFSKSTTVADLSEQSGISVSVVTRCLDYLLKQDAIFKNTNRYSNETMPYLVSEDSKTDIESWLDDCLSNLQMGMNEAIQSEE
ncbi:MAG: hypothetical protein Pars2KO_02380 [Parasphingorhabdus sp.]